MEPQLTKNVLITLFDLRRDGLRCNAGVVAHRLHVRPSQVARSLIRLEKLGLVDAARLTLTLPGLAVAVRWRTQPLSAKAA